MALKRVIPVLLLKNASLVKTVKFGKYGYIGDPANTVRIFNELEVDELCFLDITATNEKRTPNYKVLTEIADECFMPLSYGGGITNFEQAKKILGLGFEKVIINSAAFNDPQLIPSIVQKFGSQSVIGSLDVKKNIFGKPKVVSHSATKPTKYNPTEWAQHLEKMGVGEILITSVDNEGTWEGYDYDLVNSIANAVNLPVIANGGCGNTNHIDTVLNESHAQAAGVGSMVVYQKKGMGVLVNFPDRKKIDQIITKKT